MLTVLLTENEYRRAYSHLHRQIGLFHRLTYGGLYPFFEMPAYKSHHERFPRLQNSLYLPKIGDINIFPNVWAQMVANQHVSKNLTFVNNQKEWEPLGTGSIFPMQR
jgi:hypothetical protein